MERIWGPVKGFYLAAYAAPVAEGEGYCSYAKVCWSRPASYWDADCAFKVFGGEHHRSAEEALRAAAAEAGSEIGSLPPQAQSLAAQRRHDQLPIPRLFVTTFFRHRPA